MTTKKAKELKRKPPLKRAAPVEEVDLMKDTGARVGVTPASGAGEATMPSPWMRVDRWNFPPPGLVVLFFLRGKVWAGMSHHDPLGNRLFTAFGLPHPSGMMQTAEIEEFTHWRYLPSEVPR